MHTCNDRGYLSRTAIALCCLLAGAAQAGDAATCYTLASADARAWCLARARHEPSQCYAIQDSAMRAQCLAEVRGRP